MILGKSGGLSLLLAGSAIGLVWSGHFATRPQESDVEELSASVTHVAGMTAHLPHDPAMTSAIGTLDHLAITDLVVRGEVIAVTAGKEHEIEPLWPTATVQVDEIIWQAGELDSPVAAKEALIFRVVSNGRLEVGGEYTLYANRSSNESVPWRVGFALDADDGSLASGWDDARSADALAQLRGVDPQLSPAEVALRFAREQRAMLGRHTTPDDFADAGPFSAALFGFQRADERLGSWLARSPETRPLPHVREELIPGAEQALGVTFEPLEVAVVGAAATNFEVEEVSLIFDGVGVLGRFRLGVDQSAVPVIGLVPAGRAFEIAIGNPTDGTSMSVRHEGQLVTKVPPRGSSRAASAGGYVLDLGGSEPTLTWLSRRALDDYIYGLRPAGDE